MILALLLADSVLPRVFAAPRINDPTAANKPGVLPAIVVPAIKTAPDGATADADSNRGASPSLTKAKDRRNPGDIPEVVAAAPRAKNVDLENPISPGEIVAPTQTSDTEPAASGTSADPVDDSGSKEPLHKRPFLMLGAEIAPGTSTRLSWLPEQSFQGISAPTPVLVVNGVKPGPVLCLTAAVHGDELNGIEIVRRVLYNLKVDKLSGTVVGVPIVNLQGFRRASRYLSDRRDLNRFFPGDPNGSSAARIAHSFFQEIISRCDALVDLHTGSFYRTNLPQLRADLSKPEVVEITEGFGATVIVQSKGAIGTLRRAAVDIGIPAVTLEAGEPMRLQEEQVAHGVKGIRTLMNKLGMYDYSSFWGDPEPIYYKSVWVRANQGGILFSEVELGKKVDPGEQLGTITDPITNVRKTVVSPFKGRIIGMALNQFVMPGFAAFHIGIQADEKVIAEQSEATEEPETADNHSSQVTLENKQKLTRTKPVLKEKNTLPAVDSE